MNFIDLKQKIEDSEEKLDFSESDSIEFKDWSNETKYSKINGYKINKNALFKAIFAFLNSKNIVDTGFLICNIDDKSQKIKELDNHTINYFSDCQNIFDDIKNFATEGIKSSYIKIHNIFNKAKKRIIVLEIAKLDTSIIVSKYDLDKNNKAPTVYYRDNTAKRRWEPKILDDNDKPTNYLLVFENPIGDTSIYFNRKNFTCINKKVDEIKKYTKLRDIFFDIFQEKIIRDKIIPDDLKDKKWKKDIQKFKAIGIDIKLEEEWTAFKKLLEDKYYTKFYFPIWENLLKLHKNAKKPLKPSHFLEAIKDITAFELDSVRLRHFREKFIKTYRKEHLEENEAIVSGIFKNKDCDSEDYLKGGLLLTDDKTMIESWLILNFNKMVSNIDTTIFSRRFNFAKSDKWKDNVLSHNKKDHEVWNEFFLLFLPKQKHEDNVDEKE